MSLKREPVSVAFLPVKEEPPSEPVAAVYVKKEPESFEVEIEITLPVKKEIVCESGQESDTIVEGDHKVKREVVSDEPTTKQVTRFHSSNLVSPEPVCLKDEETSQSTPKVTDQHKTENSVKPASYKCYICLNTFTEESMLFTHTCFPRVKEIQETLTLYRCVLCTTRYQNEEALKRHQNYKHKKKFGTEESVNIHKNKTKPNTKGKIYRNKLQEEEQLPATTSSASVVPEKPEEKKTRELCQKKYDLKFGNFQHMRKRRKKRPYKCEICSKTYIYKHYLDLHVKQHQIRLFTCGMCKKHFSSRFHLMAHMRIHVKPYSCEICQKSFRLNSTLNKHRYIHTGGKPQCNLCKKKFALQSTLEKHMNTHHKYLKGTCN